MAESRRLWSVESRCTIAWTSEAPARNLYPEPDKSRIFGELYTLNDEGWEHYLSAFYVFGGVVVSAEIQYRQADANRTS